MTVEIVTDFRTLMQKALAFSEAKRIGDKEKIREAKADLEAYEQLCVNASRMNLGVTNGNL